MSELFTSYCSRCEANFLWIEKLTSCPNCDKPKPDAAEVHIIAPTLAEGMVALPIEDIERALRLAQYRVDQDDDTLEYSGDNVRSMQKLWTLLRNRQAALSAPGGKV